MSQISQYKTLAQLVVESMREKIMTNEIKAGQRINLDALAVEFNVSKNPIREALFLLKGEGLIIFETNKGAMVSIFNAEQVDELFSLKALIATDLLTASLPYISNEKLDEANQLLSHINLATSASDWSQLCAQYYQCLYSGSHRPLTIEVLASLTTKIERYNRLYFLNTRDKSKIHTSFSLLFEYCSQRNVEQAVTQLQWHIQYIQKQITTLCSI